jgi:hypothetical protein
MARAGGWGSSINVANPSTAPTRLSGNVSLTTLENGGSTRRVSSSISFRPAPRWQFSVNPFYERLTDAAQYVTTLTGGRPETYDRRYIFSTIDRSTLSMAVRLGLTLKPDMNLDVYAEPFAASGRYDHHGELLAPRSEERLTYGQFGTILQINPDGSREVRVGDTAFTLQNRDFNTLSFRSNVVLRWEWRPGSTLYAVWQQDRSERLPIGTRVGLDDMFRSLTAAGRNVFVVKTSFWLPVR